MQSRPLKWFFGTAALLVAACVVAVAPSTVATAQKDVPKEIKIGMTLAITGPFSVEWGPKARLWMTETEKLINERGGVFVKEYGKKLPIKFVIYDDGSSPDRAVELYEKLATVDKVDFFLGPASSPITIKASTVAEKYGIPMVAVEANSPPIFNRGFKWLVGVLQPASEWAQEYYTMLKFLMEKGAMPRVTTVAVIQEDTPHTKDVGWGGQHLAGIAGLKVVAVETVPAGVKDFSAVISKLKALNPDVVYASTWATTGIVFAQQAHELGLKPVELHITHSTNQVEFHAKVGKAIGERISGISYAASFKKGDVELWNELLRRVRLGPFDWGAGAIRFVATESLLKGIEAGGTLNRAKVMEALRQLRYESVFGPMAFRFGIETAGTKVDGVGSQIVFHAQWQDGKIQIIWPQEMATAKYVPYKAR